MLWVTYVSLYHGRWALIYMRLINSEIDKQDPQWDPYVRSIGDQFQLSFLMVADIDS